MLPDYIDRYLLSFVSLRSPQTIEWYRQRLKPLKSLNQNISSVTLFDLQQVYAQLATKKTRWTNHASGRVPKEGGLSPMTLRGYVRAWRAFFNWCVDNGALADSPARKLRPPPLPDQPPKAVSPADIERLIEAARQSSARNYAIVCILADSACRVGGLCDITLDNLDLERGCAFVKEKGGRMRYLIFTARTVEAIRAYLIARPHVTEPALFIGQRLQPLSTNGVNQMLDRLAKRAGVVGRHNPHAFRHAWARHALSAGAKLDDVAHILGHRGTTVVYQFYGRWSPDELRQIHDRYTQLPPARLPVPEDSVSQLPLEMPTRTCK